MRNRGLMRRGFGAPAFGFRRMNSLLSEMDTCFDGLEKMFGLSRLDALNENKFIPSVDVVEKDGKILAKFEVPGLSKDDLEISVENGVLTVSGEKKHEYEEKKDNIHYAEISYGSFSREISVPEGVNAEEIEAIYKDGILIVSMPKIIEAKEELKKIEIKSDE